MSTLGDRYDVITKFTVMANTKGLCVTTSCVLIIASTFNYYSFYGISGYLPDKRREKLLLEVASIADFFQEG